MSNKCYGGIELPKDGSRCPECGSSDEQLCGKLVPDLENIATLSRKFFDQVLPQAGGIVLDIGVANDLGLALSKHERSKKQ